jgi:hypothetical protein
MFLIGSKDMKYKFFGYILILFLLLGINTDAQTWTLPDGTLNDTRRYTVGYACDFWNPTASDGNTPFYGIVISNGYSAQVVGDSDHPGIVNLCSGTNANSGYLWRVYPTSTLLAGNELFEAVFQLVTTANTTVRLGFTDTGSATPPTDGAWIEINGTTLDGRTATNSSSSTTDTNYTMTASTWYSVAVVVNSDASRVDFILYDSAGATLWTNNLTTNIPTTTNRETGVSTIATNSGTTPVCLIGLDYMSFSIRRLLNR